MKRAGKKSEKMTTITVKVKRAQSYATIRDGGSYNYKYEPAPVDLMSADSIWWEAKCNFASAREKFISYLKDGHNPNFSPEIADAKAWLDEHGHKGGDWTGTIEQYGRDLDFLLGGYKKFAQMYKPTRVIYDVETLPAYALGTFDKQIGGKHMPANPNNRFNHIEEGFLKS